MGTTVNLLSNVLSLLGILSYYQGVREGTMDRIFNFNLRVSDIGYWLKGNVHEFSRFWLTLGTSASMPR